MPMYLVFPAALLSAGRIGLPRWANMLLADIAPATDRRLTPRSCGSRGVASSDTRRDPARLPLKIAVRELVAKGRRVRQD